ncbi:MAG: outer rane lipoprotein carrier protein LolA [Pseudomonadota bacterium]|jgi:chaperone LolA
MKKLALILLGISCISYANSQVLDDFLAHAKTIRADFTQTVISGKKIRTSTGKMEIARPNKFRWQYLEQQQLIVSDGQKIYLYDQPLQQVTIKPLGNSLDKSPAAVLAGANNLTSLYKINQLPDQKDKLIWVQIMPKQANDNNGFQSVLLGFASDKRLDSMKFTDNFGNKTTLKFTNLQTGLALAESDFQFKIPAGADVAQ